MLNIIQNTIGAIRRVGESVVRAGLKLWLPFTKAEPLGENVVVNGDFATDSDWNLTNVTGGGASINTNDDTLVFTNGLGYVQSNDYILENGKEYIVKIDIESVSSGLIKVVAGADGSTYSPDYTAGGLYIHYFTPTTTHGKFEIYTGSGSTSAIINSVSVEEYAQETPDISGNDNNAILKTGKALQFSGNDSVQTSFPSSYTIKTIAFWINPTHSSTNEIVFYGGGGMGGTRQLYLDHLQLEAINSNISMSTYVNGTLEGVTANGTPATLTQNEWQRVVLTSSTGFSVVSDTFDIGSGLYGSDGRFIMSDLQIYNEAWTTNDIAYDYANPQKLVTDSEDTSITLDNLKAWWHLSEGDGTIAFDSAPLIGKELLTNTSVNNASYWNTTEFGNSTATITSNGGLITVVGGDAAYIRTQSGSIFTVGKSYEVTVKVQRTTGTGGKVKVQQWANSPFATLDLNGELQEISYKFVCELADSLYISREGAMGDYVFLISNVSIKEVYNIDGETYDGSSLGASYVDAQERIPQLGMMNWSKGSNLLTYSEDFSEWSNVNSGTGSPVVLTENQLAPDGTLTATKMFFDKGTGSTTNDFVILQTSFSSQSNTASVYLRADSSQKIMIRNSTTFQLIDVSTDWVRINKTDSGGAFKIGLRGGGYVSGEPNTSTIYVWGAQVESGASATAYRRTNGTAVTNATLISSATDSQKDILGNAVRVKGSGFNLDGTGYAKVPNDTSINPTDNISFSCWFYSNSENDKGLVSKWKNGSGYMLYKQTNTLRGYINGTFKTTAVIPQSGWIYACCTFDGSNIKVYTIVPNNLDGQGNQIVNVATQSYSSTITNSSDELEIGRYNLQSGSQYSDIIDDAQVYNVTLEQSQILQNFNATKSGHNN